MLPANIMPELPVISAGKHQKDWPKQLARKEVRVTMPAHRIPDGQKAIAQELREIYGGSMTIKDVADELGVKHADTAKKWLADIPATIINGRKLWRVMDVAQKLYESRC